MTITSRAQLWNACFGNLFEDYDMALFGFLSPFLAPLISQRKSLDSSHFNLRYHPLWDDSPSSWIGIVWLYGRYLWTKTCSIFNVDGYLLRIRCIAFSPTYLQAGMLAPILFCLGRELYKIFWQQGKPWEAPSFF
jgi:hypothetical protein